MADGSLEDLLSELLGNDEEPEAGADRGAATLRAAEAAERALAAPPPGAPPPEDSLSVLTQLLADAPGDWNPQGRPDAVGAMVGGAVLLRLEELSAVVGSLASWWAAHGRPQAVAAAGQFVAVGTSSGAVVVLQLPPAHPQQPQQQGAAPPAGGAPAAAGGAAVWALGDGPKPELGPVTALAFSHPAGAQDALWLAAGHAGGVVAVWEIQKRGGKQVATIAQHGAPISSVSFFPGKGTSQLLTADRRGRAVLHTFSSMLLRTSTSSRTDGGGTARVGEGTVCLTTLSHCYVARFKPSGELLPLYSIPQPGGASHVPAAAWLPHHRRPGGGETLRHGGVAVPAAVLSLAWGPRLVLFNVPLVGDHQGAAEAASPDPASPAPAAMLRRPAPGASGGGRGAAARQAALEALTAAAASQLTGMFPLSIAGMWRPKPKRSAHKQQQGQQQQQQGQEQGQQQGQQQQQQQQHLGPEEALPVLGLHWLDQDVLAAVCQQGLSAVLLVLEGSSLQVREQLQLLDPPLLLEQAPGVGGCGASVVGLGPRVYLLTSGGLSWGRLMQWSERLKTLQDIQKFKLGLYYALSFYKNAQQHQQQQQQQQQQAPSSGGGAASPAAAAAAAGRRPMTGGLQQQLNGSGASSS
ncbi:hypothetical protein MNEG_4945 [Monoraphidium neglectum]|uniref:Uncharacterized protein n=1 Tax=Monoraphidium neglectum TaxID=145388 RepID=A0A0D2MRD8_9CHLO|nr:hypothetical protein MNEG_4945 [Monoraphidium neglectum]KIZ03017.1 hypothetical protein MNEG_4945 [Monoraphidium neglectum]|eukprot:XP_013902036.1 hypothetical protein MNEG_4945 [Monoraphidium neglectum]